MRPQQYLELCAKARLDAVLDDHRLVEERLHLMARTSCPGEPVVASLTDSRAGVEVFSPT
jgi:hypothetical protein